MKKGSIEWYKFMSKELDDFVIQSQKHRNYNPHVEALFSCFDDMTAALMKMAKQFQSLAMKTLEIPKTEI